jgi:GDP-L-fucose synthase
VDKHSKIYIAGHRGLVGSAIMRNLREKGYKNLVTRTHSELDLLDQNSTRSFFEEEKPEYVFLSAAKVGGILANNIYPAEFAYNNLMIQSNVIHEAYRSNVQRLLYLGSSCIYPKLAPQPIKEEYLLTGPLEPTNRAYALAKIAGVEMCWSYNRQHGTRFLAAMPTNLYGPSDSYHLQNSHVIPAIIRKFHLAKLAKQGDIDGIVNDEQVHGTLTPEVKLMIGLDPHASLKSTSSLNRHPTVTLWGTGTPRREFLYSEDMADACVHLMGLPNGTYESLLGSDESTTGRFEPPLINIGIGEDITIRELAETAAEITGYTGEIAFDTSKPDGTPRKLLDVSRLKAIGWEARTSLSSGLTRAYAHYQSKNPSNDVK